MTKDRQHKPQAFHPQEQSHFMHSQYTTIMDPGVTFADLFRPGFWAHARRKLKKMDEVRCVAQNGEFDVRLTVMAVPSGGVMMRYLGGDPGEGIRDPFAAAREARKLGTRIELVPLDASGKPVVRCQFLPATKWRVIGIDGNEVARGYDSQIEAEKRMSEYLKEINMRLPTETEIAEAQAAESQPAT